LKIKNGVTFLRQLTKFQELWNKITTVINCTFLCGKIGFKLGVLVAQKSKQNCKIMLFK